MAAHARQLAAQQGLHALGTPFGQPAPFMHCHADDITIHAASPSATRLVGCLPGRAGSLPQGVAHLVRRRQAGCLPGAVASQHVHLPAPLGRSCLFLPWPAPGHHTPTGGPPAVSAVSLSAIASIFCTARSCNFYFFWGEESLHAHRCQSYHFIFFLVEESLHAHRCQSYQQFERQIKQTTEECRVHSTSYDKGSCFAMA